MKKLIMAFGIIFAVLVVGGSFLNSSLTGCLRLGHALYYNDIKDDYQKVAEKYVKEKYGDYYEVIKSEGVYGGPGIGGPAFVGIEFTFSDTRGIYEND